MGWIYLGDGSAPSEQIIFINRWFQLRDAAWAARPVVRVTWQGARAYAEHYGKQLLNFNQWKALAFQRPESVAVKDTLHHESGNNVHEHMMAQSGSTNNGSSQTPANLQVNNATDQVMKEWLAETSAQDAGKIISRVLRWPHAGQAELPLKRHPWEGFVDVGFRTIVGIGS